MTEFDEHAQRAAGAGDQFAPEDAAAAEAAQIMREEEKNRRLNDLGASLAKKRKAAIDGRRQSGIEEIWTQDDDAYNGVDDLNRATEGGKPRQDKPTNMGGSLSDAEVDPTQSKLLPNITARYVDAGAARVADTLLPLDDWPFALDPGPIPELVGALDSAKNVLDQGREAQQDQALPNQGELPPGVQQPGMPPTTQPPGMPAPPSPQLDQAAQIKARAEAVMKQAKQSAKKAETRIKDWLTEGGWHGHARGQIDDAARLGSGLLKGPFPEKRKQSVWKDGQLILNEEIKPTSKLIDLWKFYPDYPACGENIQNGSFTWEYDFITKRGLSELKGLDGYIDSQIDAVIAEGPQSAESDAKVTDQRVVDNTLFQIWYFHGFLERDDVEAAGCDCSELEPEKYLSIPALITMVNGRVIRAALNPLNTGRFPYDMLVYQKRAGMPWGLGIARQVRPAQLMLTAATRAMLENAGISAKPMLAYLEGVLHPTDGNMALYGGKTFRVDGNADIREAKNAIFSIQVESRQAECMGIIQYALKMAEDVTGGLMLLQNPTGNQRTPDRVGVAEIMQGNSSALLRRVARQCDNMVIEPHIGAYYTWLLQYGTEDDEKGLFIINARGASVLAERDIQNQGIMRLVDMSVNPAFGADPKKAYAKAAQALRQDPKDWQFDDEEWRKIQENAGKQPQAPQIAVAQIRGEIEKFKQGAEDRMRAIELKFEAEQNELDRQNNLAIAVIDERMQSTELTSSERETLAKIKAELAKTAITVRAQQQSDRDYQLIDLHKQRTELAKPAFEPKGRAPDGHAFAR